MKAALLLIDIQNDYFPNGKMSLFKSEKALQNAKKILEKFRKDGSPLVHIKHLDSSSNATFFIPDTIGAEIHKSVEPLEDEKVVTKFYPNAFIETNLVNWLQSKDINQLIICGMMTHMCVDATTRAAKDLGFDCVVISDACATKDLQINDRKVAAEEVHHSFLAAFNSYYAQVINTKSYLLVNSTSS